MSRFVLALIVTLSLCTACDRDSGGGAGQQPETGAVAAAVDGARITNADSEPHNWMSHGRTYGEQRFSPLNQINAQNISELGLAWYVDLGSRKGIEATPLVVDGTMYTSGPHNMLYAFDAANGTELWRYDPRVDGAWLRYVCCGWVNRGVALWRGKVYEGLIDGRLIAVDAGTGALIWEVQTTDTAQPYSITGAPRIVNGKVIIGNGGAEYGVRGYVSAYDAESGELLWRFYTVPGNPALGFESAAMEMAAATWSGEWWQAGGGGTAWDSFAFDPELNLLYIGTGNGSPWARELRSPGGGDNLFLSSIVAVDADSGEYVWHYQTTPAENWDFTATQPMILAELEIAGRMRRVIMQAPKNGFFYVIDRASGELLSAEAIVPTNWASHVDMASGRPVEIAENTITQQAKLITPGPNGAHDWHPMSYSPLTGLVYIPAHEMWWVYSSAPEFNYRKWAFNLGNNPNAVQPPEAAGRLANGKGFLLAWDPVRQRQAWRVEMGRGWNGGVLTTAGNLLIQGAADGRFVIYRADSGEKLWETPIHTGAVAGPITYAVDGEQYIAVAAGWGGAFTLMGGGMGDVHHSDSRILAFKLGAGAALPPPAPTPVMPEPPPLQASAATLARGEALYGGACANCHGFNAISGGSIPDLRYISPTSHAAFAEVVLGGILAATGMASFSDVLTNEDVEAIHAYLIKQAQIAYRSHARD